MGVCCDRGCDEAASQFCSYILKSWSDAQWRVLMELIDDMHEAFAELKKLTAPKPPSMPVWPTRRMRTVNTRRPDVVRRHATRQGSPSWARRKP